MIFLDVKTGYSTDKFSQIKSKIKKISTLFCGLRRIKLTMFLKKFFQLKSQWTILEIGRVILKLHMEKKTMLIKHNKMQMET